MQKLVAIGLMTGSSMDGIDGAMVLTDGGLQVQHLASFSIKYVPELHIALRAAEYAVQQTGGDLRAAEENFVQYLSQYEPNEQVLRRVKSYLDLTDKEEIKLQVIIKKITVLHSDVVEQLLIQNKISADKVDVIGFHGQTLYHNVEQKKTIQIGDPQLLAQRTGIFVVHDFRSHDLQNRGQGAPLAPLYHYVLALATGLLPMSIVNCGGIANMSIISDDKLENVLGFDVGPGNILIDQYVRKSTGNKEFYDLDGRYGKQGRVDKRLLKILQEEVFVDKGFLQKLPPKALDASNLQIPPIVYHFPFYDACITLEAFTAYCIVESLNLLQNTWPKNWVLAGGGWKNPIITNFLRQLAEEKIGRDIKFYYADDCGWSGQYLEAEMFAYFAVRSLKRLPLSFPKTTGVACPTVGGRGYMPSVTTDVVASLLKENVEILSGYK